MCGGFTSRPTLRHEEPHSVIDDRTKLIAKKVSDFLKESRDRFQKTIVFCVDEEHAARMRQALINENKDLCDDNYRYVMRITGSDTALPPASASDRALAPLSYRGVGCPTLDGLQVVLTVMEPYAMNASSSVKAETLWQFFIRCSAINWNALGYSLTRFFLACDRARSR